MSEQKKTEVKGLNILADECIWAKAGIVSFKRCTNAFDCNTCQFDKAMFVATQSDSEKVRKPTLRESLGRRSARGRECRHMLTGRVDKRFCDNDFKCETCEFDQMLDYADELRPAGGVPLVEVAGYRYADSNYYHDGHTWARVEAGGRIRIGVDDFAMKLLGRPDAWECPGIGGKITRSARGFSLARSGNRADFLSPVNGTVIAVNRDSLERPGLVHADPFNDGWLVLVEPHKIKKNVDGLHFGAKGKSWLVEEAQRLHDLCAPDFGRLAATGAAPIDDVFGEVPEIGWRTLVSKFLKS